MSIKKLSLISSSYASKLRKDGKYISLPSNSDLVPLVRASLPSLPCGVSATSDLVEDELTKSDEAVSFNEYNNLACIVKDELKDILQRHIRVVKEIVQMIEEGVEKVNKYVSNLPDHSPMSMFKVLEDPLPTIFENDRLKDIIDREPAIVRQPTSRLVTRERNENEIIGLISLESDLKQNLLEDLANLSTEINPSPLLDIYNDYIRVNSTIGNKSIDDARQLPSGEAGIVCLTVMAICEGLKEDIPEDAVGNLASFTENCNNLSSTLHSLLASSLEQKKYQIEQGILILSMSKDSVFRQDGVFNEVVVDSCTYNSFLEAGGSAELLLGNVVNNLGNYTVKDLVDNAERCQESWNIFSSVAKESCLNDRRQYMLAIYKAVWAELLEQKPAYEEELRNKNPNYATYLTTEITKWLNVRDNDELFNVYYIMESLLAKFRFVHTAADSFIREMNRSRKDNPDRDIREHISVATIKYLTSYYMTQVSVNFKSEP